MEGSGLGGEENEVEVLQGVWIGLVGRERGGGC